MAEFDRYAFSPIKAAPRDGQTLILSDDTGWLAAGFWAEDMWALGHKRAEGFAVQLDFEPTKFALPLKDQTP